MDPFELPADLTGLTAAELAALRDQAQREIDVYVARANAGQTLSTEDQDDLQRLIDGRDAVRDQHSTVEAADQAAGQNLADLLSRATPAAPAAPEAPAAPAAPEAPAAPAAEAPAASAAPAAPAEHSADSTVLPGSEAAPAAVAASSAPANFTPPGAGDGTRPEAAGPGWQMLPSAPGYHQFGQDGAVGFGQIARGMASITQGGYTGMPTGTRGRFATQAMARLQRDLPLCNTPQDLVAEINRVTSTDGVTAESLTASGGWCAPSEQLYDFCDVPDPTNLVSLPEVNIERGGVRWPQEPDVSALLSNYAFQFYFTEQQLEALDGNGDPTAIKELIEVTCPETFNELRLNAIGWGVKLGILQDQAWPELTEWWLRTFTAAHLRGISWRTVNDMVAGSGTPIVFNAENTIGAVGATLNSLGLAAINLRLKRGLPETTIIEGVAPSWLREVLRADLALRDGRDNLAVSNGEIDGWFSARNISLQFIDDWQSRGVGQPGHLQTVQFPGTVNVLLYPAGTWFRAMSPVITLGTMYPLEQVVLNRFTRYFTEDAILVGKRCNDSINVSVPICASGAVGARGTITCPSFDPGDNSFSLNNTATGGQLKLKFAGAALPTADIAYNATNTDIKNALGAIDDGHPAASFTVSGTNPKTILAPRELGALTVEAGTSPLTGGTATVS